jgi:putative ABC transport system permease protein
MLSIYTIAWKNVSRKLFRNIVVSLAVALLVALLVFAMLFDNAVKEDIDAASRKLGADIVLVPAAAKELAEQFILESREKTFYMSKKVYDEVIKLPEIESGTFQIYLDTLESECCSIVEGQVVAFDQNTDFVISSWVAEGANRKLKAGEVYVGSYVAEYLGLIGTATLFGHDVTVVGNLEETGTGLDHGVFMRVEDLDMTTPGVAGQFRQGNISIVFLKLKEGVAVDDVVRKIVSIDPSVGIMTRGTIGGDVKATLEDIIRIFSITILISSILAILLAWSTFTALANERQREVGIMRAIGANRYQIIKMFLSEAVIISGLGGILGIFIGHFLIQHLAQDFQLLTRLGAISVTSMQTILLSLTSLVIGVIVCLFGALLPVIRLASLEPLLAIKEE